MGKGLETLSGSKLQGILERKTANPIIGVLLGAVVTAILQSSSTTTVMVVGFVNSGIMRLSQAVGVIMGANIGTTATPWILSLTGIQGKGFWIRFLNPFTYVPLLAMVGVILLFRSNARQKDSRKKDLGMILIGFAILIFGMQIMSVMVKPLAVSDTFARLMQLFFKSDSRYRDRMHRDGDDSKFFRHHRDLANVIYDRTDHLWNCDPHHSGTEYWNLRFRAFRGNRGASKCPKSCDDSFVF